MATIKGQHLRILVGDDTDSLKCIAASTNCVMHCALQVAEDTTKDNVDDWIENEPVGLNWDVQVDALIIDNADGAQNIALLQEGRQYMVRFSRTSGDANREEVTSPVTYSGMAILSDLIITATNNDISTATAKFTGNGELWPAT